MTGTGGVDDIERAKAAFEHLLRDEFDIAHSTLEFENHGRGARGGARCRRLAHWYRCH
jgi:hypothetical protein